MLRGKKVNIIVQRVIRILANDQSENKKSEKQKDGKKKQLKQKNVEV